MGSSALRCLPYADTASIMLRFASGALGTISASDTASAPWSWELTSGENRVYPQQQGQPCYLLFGNDGALALPQLKQWHYNDGPDWHAPMHTAQAATDTSSALARQLRHFIAVARGEAEPLVDIEDAAHSLSLVDAVARAMTTNHAVTPVAPWDT